MHFKTIGQAAIFVVAACALVFLPACTNPEQVKKDTIECIQASDILNEFATNPDARIEDVAEVFAACFEEALEADDLISKLRELLELIKVVSVAPFNAAETEAQRMVVNVRAMKMYGALAEAYENAAK